MRLVPVGTAWGLGMVLAGEQRLEDRRQQDSVAQHDGAPRPGELCNRGHRAQSVSYHTDNVLGDQAVFGAKMGHLA